METDIPEQPLPETPTHQPPRRLYRSTSDRKIAGVAGGLADYFGIDPTLVRVGFLIGTFAGGAGLIAYFVLWVAVPEGQSDRLAAASWRSSIDTNTAFAISFLALAFLFGIAGPLDDNVILPLALLGAGIYLLSQRPLAEREDRGDRPAPPLEEAAAPLTAWPPPPMPDATTPVSPRPPREPAYVTRLVLSLIAVATGIGIAAQAGDWWDVNGNQVLGASLVIVGVGSIVGSIVGRNRGLIPLGILLSVAVIPVSALGAVLDDGVGTRTYAPLTLDDLQERYELGIGELEVDLSRLELNGAARRVVLDLGIGEARLIVRDDATVLAELDVGVGEAEIRGLTPVDEPGRVINRIEEGFGNEIGPLTVRGDGGTLEVLIDVGIGHGEISQHAGVTRGN